MTQSFFLTLRSLHLSFAPMIRDYDKLIRYLSRQNEAIVNEDPRALHLLRKKYGHDCELLHPELLTDLVNFSTAFASVLLNALNAENDNTNSTTILTDDYITVNQRIVLEAIPQYAVEDIMITLIFIAKSRADLLNIPQISSVLELVIFFLRRPTIPESPHIRAIFGELLFQVYLPNKDRDHMWNERYSQQSYPDGLSAHIAESSVIAQNHLAPSLLLLYGF